jgi:hypothetical protein
MKTRLHITSILGLLALLAGPIAAHPDGHGEESHALPKPKATAPAKPALTLPATATETIATIQRQLDALKAALEDGKLPAVRSNALTLNELVKHIVALVPADHQASVKEIAERHSKLTDELSKAASAGAQKEVESLVSKITGNLRALKPFVH